MDRHLLITYKEKLPKTIICLAKEIGISVPLLTALKKDQKCVLLNSEEGFLNRELHQGDKLELIIKETEENPTIAPQDIPLDIIYEDDDIIVINKPAYMPVHPSLNHPLNTLANALVYYYRNESSPFVFRCLTRLDKNTTGLTLIAKNPLSSAILNKDMKAMHIHRIYYGIFDGEIINSGTVDAPIGRVNDSIIKRCIDTQNGKAAITHYDVIKSNYNYSLCRLTLETGRTHQIRVHMSHIGHPLINDFLYGDESTGFNSRQLLHAGEISIVHPITKKNMTFNTPLPDDFNEYMSNH